MKSGAQGSFDVIVAFKEFCLLYLQKGRGGRQVLQMP